MKYLVFQDETGITSDERYFIVGMLIINKNEENNFRQIISSVRQRNRFYDEIHFQKTSKLRHKVYKELLEEVFNYGKYKFHMIVVDKKILDMNYFGGSNKLGKALMYNKFTQLRLFHSMKSIGIGSYYVYPDEKNRIKEDNFVEYLKNQINFESFYWDYGFTVKTVEPQKSHGEELLQLNDLFLGGLGEFYNIKENLSDRKKDISNLIKKDFEHNPRRYNIWEWKPRKTKE